MEGATKLYQKLRRFTFLDNHQKSTRGRGGAILVSNRNIRHKKNKMALSLLDDRDKTLLKRGGPQQ